MRPNLVTLSGPRAAIERLRADPSQLQLTPVNIDGRSTTVTQIVNLPQDLLDDDVTLQTPNGTAEVSVFIVPEDKTVDLISVPVVYLNADTLVPRKLRVAQATTSFDLKVIGPELDKLTPDQLRQKIVLLFDWWDASDSVVGHPAVRVATVGLPEGVRVQNLANGDEPPHILYSLEPIPEPK